LALPYPITTGEQQVTATGAVTGTLSTTNFLKTGMIKMRIRGLTSNQSLRVAVEDTNNVTPFSDALQVWTVDTAQGQNPDGNEYSVAINTLPDMRIGTANSALRLNVQAITGTTTAYVIGWIEQ
jgi:hypothetical protein